MIQPKLQMFDALDRWVQNVGTKLKPWVVTVSLVPGYGDPAAYLMGNVTARFINGTANFTNLAISHNSTGYILQYNVTYPETVSFSVTYGPHTIKERILGFNFTTNLTNLYETLSLSPQPTVSIYDTANNEPVMIGWKNRTWYLLGPKPAQ